MNGSELITNFETYVDDATELSSAQELTLVNKIYKRVLRSKPWEFLKKTATGTLSLSSPYVSLPDDFSFLPVPSVFYAIRNGNYSEVGIINFSDRRGRTGDNVAYIDLVNNRLVFTTQPTVADTYEFDYIYMPADLTLSTSPIFPADFHPVIYHGMAVDSDIINLSEKARSYTPENQAKYNSYLSDMNYYNAQLIL